MKVKTQKTNMYLHQQEETGHINISMKLSVKPKRLHAYFKLVKNFTAPVLSKMEKIYVHFGKIII